MYTSMWIMKPTQDKMAEAKKMLKKFRNHWKRHGAVETECAMLHGTYLWSSCCNGSLKKTWNILEKLMTLLLKIKKFHRFGKS